jgi:L-lysine exporter family protein LysE/ArgO
MTIGVYGGGALINSNNFLYSLITWGGIAFLTVYGALFFKSFLFAKNETTDKVKLLKSRKAVIFTTLAVTLLNPHVYLDTIVIIGSISGKFEANEKFAFLIGTIIASLVWFYSLSFAAEKLSPWLSKTLVQRFINLLVALIMWGIALSLFMSH